jgi:hypothetical protein
VSIEIGRIGFDLDPSLTFLLDNVAEPPCEAKHTYVPRSFCGPVRYRVSYRCGQRAANACASVVDHPVLGMAARIRNSPGNTHKACKRRIGDCYYWWPI